MVFEDVNSQKPNQKNKTKRSKNGNVANPFDRLGAFVIDVFIVLTPLVSLVTAPLKKVMMASALFEHESSFNFIAAFGFLLAFILAVAYQYLCLVYLNGSVGKKVFRLRVEGLFEKDMDRAQAFARAFAWPLAPISLGLSCLGVLSDKNRRAFHDRWADTRVVSLASQSETPSHYEVWLARSVRVGLLAIFGLFVLVGYTQFYAQLASGRHLQRIMESRGDLCREVSGFYEELSGHGSGEGRLNAAFTMYNLGDLDKSCLVEEVDFAFRYEEPSDLAYLIKSVLVRDTNKKLSKLYRERLCKDDTERTECKVGELFTAWENKSWVLAEEQLSELLAGESPGYLKPWGIELKLMMGKHEEMNQFLSELPQTVSFRRYTAKMKAMASAQGVHKSPETIEAVQNNLQSLADVFNSFESFELASWMCYQSYQVSCEARETSSCKAMDDMINVSPELLVDDYLAAIWVKKQSCGVRTSKSKYKEYLQRPAQKLLAAIKGLKSSPIQSRNKLWGLATNIKHHSSVSAEAARYYIESAKSKEELKRMVISWKLWDPTFEWQVTGQKLIDQLYDFKDHRSVITVGELLAEKSEVTRDIKQKMFVSYYKEMEHKKARQILSELKVVRREVANSSEFKTLSRRLLQKNGRSVRRAQ